MNVFGRVGDRLTVLVVGATASLLGAFSLAAPAQAVTFTVNSTVDAVDVNPGDGVCATAEGTCTLRAAIQEANALAGADTIILPAGTYPLSSAVTGLTFQLEITDDLTLTGAGPTMTVIEGDGLHGVFRVTGAGKTISISGVTVRRGFAFQGGGIANVGASLTLSRVVIAHNGTLCGGAGLANGSGGSVTLIDSTLTNNSAPTTCLTPRIPGEGGGILNGGDGAGSMVLVNVTISNNQAGAGGGIFNFGTLTLTNVTITGNLGQRSGGGIFNSRGTVQLNNVTVAKNSGGSTSPIAVAGGGGGGIHNSSAGGVSGTVTLQNTLIAGNSDQDTGLGPECFGTFNSLGHNLIQDTTGCSFTGNTTVDVIGQDPLLAPLGNNRGLTFTHALLPGSPALDAGDNGTCAATDQRGVTRPRDGNADGVAVCDIGAYERGADELNPSTILAAILPNSRSVQVGTPATAFATVINRAPGTAFGCSISLATNEPGTFNFQTTNPATNNVTGTLNTTIDIPAAASQSFVFAYTPIGVISPTEIPLSIVCANASASPTISGVNTLPFSASATPVPDIVALAATLGNNGIVDIPGATGTRAFAVATVNVGASGTITASADTGAASPPVSISLCQTDPASGQCISPVGPSVTTQINANATPTFGIFVTGTGTVPFDPAVNRIFVRFKDVGGVTRGSTSVAVRTQ